MTKAVEKETGGDVEDALLFLIGIKLGTKTAGTLAKAIKSTTKGINKHRIIFPFSEGYQNTY